MFFHLLQISFSVFLKEKEKCKSFFSFFFVRFVIMMNDDGDCKGSIIIVLVNCLSVLLV